MLNTRTTCDLSTRWGATLAIATALTACTGQIQGTGGLAGAVPGEALGGPLSAGSPDGDPRVATLPFPVSTNGRPSALRRLTRDELVTSLSALVGTAPKRADFPQEPRSGHGPLFTTGVSFIGTEVSKLDQLIDDFATAQAPTFLAKSGCKLSDQAQRDCLLDWSVKFAEQALRRPLVAGERDGLQTIIGSVKGLADADKLAMEGVLRAILFAPSFLYRTELGTAAAGNGPRTLTPSEIAAKLSFLATLGPPDAVLQAAAKSGTLSSGPERAKQFARLSATGSGAHALAVLVLEWLGANEPKVEFKATKYLGGLAPDFAAALRASAESTITRVLSSATPTLQALLTTDTYLQDAAVQSVMQPAGSGKTASGDGPTTARAGLLMHPLVIAAHTKEDGSSPFQIGSALREVVMCNPVAAPPPGATALAKQDVPPGLTTRESLEYRTAAGPVCNACHSQFAPVGFAFLPFDPVGRWQVQDPTGKPWNLAGQIQNYDGKLIGFDSPSNLAKTFADEPQVKGCFAQVALEWSLGRTLVAEDQTQIVALNEIAQATEGGVAKLLEAIVSAPQFTTAVSPR